MLHFDPSDDGKVNASLRGVFVPRDSAIVRAPRAVTAWFGHDSASLVARGVADQGSGRTGTAYLQRRRHEDALRGEVERAARSRAAACHEELAALADEAVVLPRRGNGARRSLQMIRPIQPRGASLRAG